MLRVQTQETTAFEWEQIDRLGQPFKYHLRPVLQAVDFTAVSAQEPLMEAMTFLKETFRKGKPLSQHPPQAFPTGVHSGKRGTVCVYER
jgi:hypothetical protein